jgi:dienelactone hydrolase
LALAALGGAVVGRATPTTHVYARCLPDYLRSLAADAYRTREAAGAKLTTPQAIRDRQQWIRRTFWQVVGGEPERTPLNVRRVREFERPGYRVIILSYDSRPGVTIPANLYIPTTGQGPYPGVLFQMGHSLNGKAAEPYQKCCQGLARLGYVVLAFDPMGQGERTYYHVDDADEEHSRAGRQMLLVGDTMTRLQTWDAVRSLDVLAGLPEVDPKRLASTGQSGGGTLTMLLTAVDDRLACASVSSGNTENFACRDFDPPGSTDDAEQDLIGAAPLGLDRWDLLYPHAPKPLQILVSERDSFGTYSPNYRKSGDEEFAKLKRVYETLGHSDLLASGSAGLPHALSRPMRVQIYNFFERWLRGSNRVVDEPDVKPEPDSELLAGVKAQRTPMAEPRPTAVKADELRSWIGDWAPSKPTVLAKDRGEGCEIHTVEIASAPGVYIPAYIFVPLPGAPRRKTILLCEPGGRTRRWREGDLCHRLAAGGFLVCAFDVRGVGDLSPEVGRGNPAYTRSHSNPEAYAWGSLMLAKPMLGQRAADILAVRAAMAGYDGPRPLVLAASDFLTTPALLAAAVDEGFETTYLSGGLISWRSILSTDSYVEPLANFQPGGLLKTDLPFIAKTIAPRRVVVAGAIDGEGKSVPVEDVRQLYGSKVEVRPGPPPLDVETFLKL